MPFKTYKVNFAVPTVGDPGRPLHRTLAGLHEHFGEHWPPADVEGTRYRIRDLVPVGRVWLGTFAKLVDDLPHIIDADDQEHEIDLDPGDKIIDKCHFLYRGDTNVLVLQVNKAAGGITRLAQYMAHVAGVFVDITLVQNNDRLARVMQGQVYEIDIAFARPGANPEGIDPWSQVAFDMMRDTRAAHARFNLRSPRGGSMSEGVKRYIRDLAYGATVKKLKIRLTEETDLVDVVMSPMKDRIRVEMDGRYPVQRQVYEELEEAYARNRDNLRAALGR